VRVDQRPRQQLLGGGVETLDEGASSRRCRYGHAASLDEPLDVGGLGRPGGVCSRAGGAGSGRGSVGRGGTGRGAPGRAGIGRHELVRDGLSLAEAQELLEDQQFVVDACYLPAIEHSTAAVLQQPTTRQS